MKKHYYSWTDIEESVLGIVAKIEQDNWKPDLIIGIANGGSIPATLISKAMNIPCKIVTVQLRDGNTKEVYDTHGKNILIVDEINDTGETLDWIFANWNILSNTKIATLTYNKPSIVKSDYFYWHIDKDIEPVWIVYPWESFVDNALD